MDSGILSFITNDLAACRLAWPWALLALAVPLFWRFARRGEAPADPVAIRLPLTDALPLVVPPARRGTRGTLFGLLIYGLLVLAAARPQWIDPADRRPASGRDLLLLLDVSASMKVRDLTATDGTVSRLDAAVRFGRAFLERRSGDRAGLIVFASRPYLYVPLTYDLAAVAAALDGTAVGLAGEKTALGDAVALAVRTLTGAPAATDDAQPKADGAPAHAVAVLISDGANTAGAVTPQQAAWLAAQRRVRVHALAVGTAPVDDALPALAGQSGGTYARATDVTQVADFFARLDGIEGLARADAPVSGAARELYAWPLAAGVVLVLLGMAGRVRRGRHEHGR